MKNKTNLLVIFLCFCVQTSFSQDKPGIANEYESCCGTTPVEFSLEKKNVYVPNVFTPNKDGVNDYFAPYINEIITEVWGFSIYNAKGDTLIYRKDYFNSKMDIREFGWNGLKKDGSPYKGAFTYKMRIDDRDANKHIIEGKACAILCDPNSKIIQTKEGCFYPSQAGLQGKLDKSKAVDDKGCFN